MADERPSLTARLVRRLVFGPSPRPAPTPAPAPAPAPVVAREDSAQAPAPSQGTGIVGRLFGRAVRRLDAVRNWRIGFGQGDRLTAGRPDIYRDKLRHIELTCLWRMSGYSRRYVEYMPKLATRNRWTLLSADGSVDMEEEYARLDLVTAVCDADTWGRLYGGAWICVMVDEAPIPGVRPDDLMAHPLDPERVISVNNLVVLEESEVDPYTYEGDPHESGYRESKVYRVTPRVGGLLGDRSSHFAAGSALVHKSRMLYFPGSKLPPAERWRNNGIDDSILQSVWDQVRNKETLGGALAHIATEMRIAAIKLSDMGVAVEDMEAYFATRMQMLVEHKSIANAVLLAPGEEFQQVSGTVAGMAELDGTSLHALQSVTGMPEQLWLGSAPGGLSTDGESHRNLTAQEVKAYQVQRYTKPLRQLHTFLFAAKEGPWAGVAPEDWSIRYNPLDELTDAGRADLMSKVGDLDVKMITAGVYTATEVRNARFANPQGWQMDMVLEPREEPPPEPAQLPGPAEGAPPEEGATQPPAPPVDPEAATLADRRRLADEMTEAGAERCYHGNPNRCRICGVERRQSLLRDASGAVLRDADGAVQWDLRWAAINDYDTDGDPNTQEPDPEAVLDGALRSDSYAYVRGLLARERARPAPPRARTDAEEVGVYIGIPLPEAALPTWESARSEAAVIAGVTPEELDLRGHAPHVTLLYVGKVQASEADDAADRCTAVLDGALDASPESADGDRPAAHRPIPLQGVGLSAFTPSTGSNGDTPLYMAIEGDTLRALHEQLSRALLTEEERAERPWYEPHATVGYLAGELEPRGWWGLWSALGGHGRWEASEVQLSVGGEVVARWVLSTEK